MTPQKKKYWKVPVEILGTYLVIALMAYCAIIIFDNNVDTTFRVIAIVGLCILLLCGFVYIFYDITGRIPFSKIFRKKTVQIQNSLESTKE